MTSHRSPSAPLRSTILGFPREGFGCLTSLLLTFALAFLAFFAVTTTAIFALLGWNLLGSHAVNYADSYLYAGLPAGLLTLAVAAPVFAVLWFKARRRK